MNTRNYKNYQHWDNSQVEHEESWNVPQVKREENWNAPQVKQENWNVPQAKDEENWNAPQVKQENWNVPQVEHEEIWNVPTEMEPIRVKASSMYDVIETIPSTSVSNILNQQEIEVHIGAIYDPSKFWVILSDGYHHLDKLMDDLQVAYARENPNLKIVEGNIKSGMYCVSLFNGEYHRGLVKKVTLEKHEATVLFIDYGIVDVVDSRELYFLTKKFGHLPRQAVRARLSGIQPAVCKTPWSLEARNNLIEQVENQIIFAKVCNVDKERQIVEVILTVNSICVNDALVTEKLAVYGSQLTQEAAQPSFDELEEDISEPPLPQEEILLKFSKPTTILETKLHENPVHLFFVRKQICISILEMIKLTRLENISVGSIKKRIIELNFGESLCDVEIQEEEIKMKLRNVGIKSENNAFSLILVEFIPEFFKIFTDIVFPHALFGRFLKEVYTLL